MAPPTYCVLCGMNWKNIEHMFVNYLKIKNMWNHLSNALGSNIEFGEGIGTGLWLRKRKCSDSVCVSFVIVVVLLMVWKTICNAIFKGI